MIFLGLMLSLVTNLIFVMALFGAHFEKKANEKEIERLKNLFTATRNEADSLRTSISLKEMSYSRLRSGLKKLLEESK